MSRDPARIDPMLDKLRELWHKSPDLRLGQLVYNLAQPVGGFPERDVFYVEDDAMIANIEHKLETT